ncbi:TraR/DksA family transcriptional regulator [Niabella drilacis]|uniref:Transcriptional regulator, TraR/DksA family n=1 Tax=Niabella drilacis (strain DSM 25811 / CCM 8410 / CCUG 62505 / LMG 26954 / E90) TaxID=1285928 RepID=A0A1G6PMY8_NIADE|nr:TraR/DksA C4-type zinc finger protein [Niabella drilacis]SDC80866.1 transcriptional regulator, TraR/DksA family [Niabella drilacis]
MATKKKTAAKPARATGSKAVSAKAPVKAAGGKVAKAPAKSASAASGKASKPKTPAKAASKPAVSSKATPKTAAVRSGASARPAAGKAAKTPAKPVNTANGKTAKAAVTKTAKTAPKPVSKAAPAHEKKAAVKKPAVKELVPVIEKSVAKKETKEDKKAAKAPKKVVVPKLSTKSSVKYQPDFTKSVLDTPAIEKATSVVRYSDNDLTEFKEIILRKLDAAKKELAYLQGLITRRDEGGDMDEGRYMTMEDGSVSMEREQLSQLASRQITFIDHLEKALMRVENKTYGICRVTGHLIDKARLRAVPHATLSIEAKSMMNR